MLGLELGLLLLDQTVDPVQVDLDRLANRHGLVPPANPV